VIKKMNLHNDDMEPFLGLKLVSSSSAETLVRKEAFGLISLPHSTHRQGLCGCGLSCHFAVEKTKRNCQARTQSAFCDVRQALAVAVLAVSLCAVISPR
jgi:hypothetical protein